MFISSSTKNVLVCTRWADKFTEPEYRISIDCGVQMTDVRHCTEIEAIFVKHNLNFIFLKIPEFT